MEDRFKNREEAGQELALFIEQQGRTFDLIYAVPRGGVEVAAPIAARLGLPLQVVFIRKLPYPFSPEMGFGSVDEKGQILINPEAMGDSYLTEEVVEGMGKKVHEEVLRRKKEFSPHAPEFSPEGKKVLLVDDGIATGASLRAAIHYLKSFQPKEVWIATGCGYEDSLEELRKECDGVICLATQESGPFAVARFYEDFQDRSDEEIKEILTQANQKWIKV